MHIKPHIAKTKYATYNLVEFRVLIKRIVIMKKNELTIGIAIFVNNCIESDFTSKTDQHVADKITVIITNKVIVFTVFLNLFIFQTKNNAKRKGMKIRRNSRILLPVLSNSVLKT